jgi:hypothetical protein
MIAGISGVNIVAMELRLLDFVVLPGDVFHVIFLRSLV